MPEGTELVQRTCLYPPELWEAGRRAAALMTARTGEQVSINDLQRWGLHRQIVAIRDGELEPPEEYNHG